MSYTQAWLESREHKSLEAAQDALVEARVLLWDILAEANALGADNDARFPEELPGTLAEARTWFEERDEKHVEEWNEQEEKHAKELQAASDELDKALDRRDENVAEMNRLLVELAREKEAHEAAQQTIALLRAGAQKKRRGGQR